MSKLLVILASVLFLAGCSKNDTTAGKPVEEEEYSEWFDTLDTQLRSIELNGSASLWKKLEGRNRDGVSEFRWVREERPEGEKFKFAMLWNSTVDEYYDEGMQWHMNGYERISRNVFIDASGTARYQAVWIYPGKPRKTVIEPSVLDETMVAERESRFTPWESLSVLQKRFDERPPGTGLLYQEMKDGRIGRSIFTDPGDGFHFWARVFCNRIRFLRYHKEYANDGFRLLTVSDAPHKKFGTQFSAVWSRKRTSQKLPGCLRNSGSRSQIQSPKKRWNWNSVGSGFQDSGFLLNRSQLAI